MSIAFAAAVSAVERASPQAPTGVAFDRVVQLLPVYFLAVAAIFLLWARRQVGGDRRLTEPDGFASQPPQAVTE